MGGDEQHDTGHQAGGSMESQSTRTEHDRSLQWGVNGRE
jgi:hypothetical protein